MSIQFVEATAVETFLAEHPELLLIDVRDRGDHASLCMPGSLCIPLVELGSSAALAEHAERPVLFICQLGKRAMMAAQTVEPGVANPLYVLSGGLNACLEAGVALTRGDA